MQSLVKRLILGRTERASDPSVSHNPLVGHFASNDSFSFLDLSNSCCVHEEVHDLT